MALSLLSFGLILVLGSIMSMGAPFWTRIVAIVPFAALFVALALDQSWELLEKAKARGLASGLTLGVVALLIFAGWTEWNSYYKWGATNAEPITRAGRYLGTLPLRVAACRFQHSYFMLHDFELEFLAGPRQLMDIPADASDADIDTCPGPPLVWILSPDQLDRLDALRAHWPNGIVEEHRGTDGDLSFTSYLVAP